MSLADNAIAWFEIPASDMVRARRFYETLFPGMMTETPCDVSGTVLVFDMPNAAVKGALVPAAPDFQPASATTVYLNAGPDLNTVLSKIEGAGGTVLLPKTALPEPWGFHAHFRDSEGNRVGLHSLS